MILKTIKVSERTKKLLDKCKKHPRETYESLLARLAKEEHYKIGWERL